jgi:hypothetical protein
LPQIIYTLADQKQARLRSNGLELSLNQNSHPIRNRAEIAFETRSCYSQRREGKDGNGDLPVSKVEIQELEVDRNLSGCV